MIAVEVAKYLAQEIAGLTYDDVGTTGNVFVGSMPDTGAEAVMVKGTGGPESDTKLGYDSKTVQVLVRGTPARDRLAGYARATEIYGVLHGKTSVDLPDGTRLILARALQSGPNDIGEDEQGRQEWSLNFELEVRAVTTNRE